MSGKARSLMILGIIVLPLFALMVGLAAAQSPPPLSDIEALGKAIFFDTNLSVNFNQSCASCHTPEAGWVGSDGAVNAAGAVYEGSIPGAFGDRKPPSAAYATQAPILHMTEPGEFVGGNFWDGRATGETLGSPAAEQAQGPFLNSAEQALPSAAEVVSRICASDYSDLFRKVWGPNACTDASAYDYVAFSIAAYEASPEVNAFTSKFDAKKAGLVRFTKEESKGWSLFKGKALCAKCHIASGTQPLFTDYTFDNLGLPQNPENPAGIAPAFVDRGLGAFLETRPDYAAYAAANMGKHKVPTLRNVGLGLELPGAVKAYGHNGYFKTLEGIVHFYNTRDVKPVCPGLYTEAEALAAGCWPAPEVAENVNDDELGDLGLSPQEEGALVAFLKTLSDGWEPAA